jgi:membrane protease YdiL (CAAX protease family)
VSPVARTTAPHEVVRPGGLALASPVRFPLLVALSPLAVVLAGHLVARAAAAVDPWWAWVPVALVYWAATAATTLAVTTPAQRRAWWAPASPRPWWVVPVAAALGVMPVGGILLLHLDLVAAHPALVAPWLLFAAINPVMEETYWRGTVADAVARWPVWAAALWTTALFVASHPLMWGVFSAGNRSPMLYGALALMGLAWFAVRRATGSLRWAVASHALVDVGNLSVFVFVNVYVPPGIA